MVSLDEAIAHSVQQIQKQLDYGSTIIVYQFQSPHEGLSDYILKELFNLLVNSYKYIVLDRSAQKVIDAELDFQFKQSAGMISDESLASLTKRIGAKAIITGSLDNSIDEYRFRIQAIGTETTAAVVSYAVSVDKYDKKIAAYDYQPPTPLTTGEKISVGALNLVLGLGSFFNGDIIGSLTISTGYLVGAGLIVIDALVLDWDNPMVGVPATIGVTVAGLSIVYGFVRPFIYNHSTPVALMIDNTQLSIIPVADKSGAHHTANLQLTYSIKY